MARAARTRKTVQDDSVALAEDAPVEQTATATPAETWEWEPADPSEVPSDPTPAPQAEATPPSEATLDDYLNLALMGIAGLSLMVLLTRPRH